MCVNNVWDVWLEKYKIRVRFYPPRVVGARLRNIIDSITFKVTLIEKSRVRSESPPVPPPVYRRRVAPFSRTLGEVRRYDTTLEHGARAPTADVQIIYHVELTERIGLPHLGETSDPEALMSKKKKKSSAKVRIYIISLLLLRNYVIVIFVTYHVKNKTKYIIIAYRQNMLRTTH